MEHAAASFVIAGEPVYGLHELIALRPEAHLERLRTLAGQPELADWLCTPDTLSMLLTALPRLDFDLFLRAANVPFLRDDEANPAVHSGLIAFLIIQPFQTAGGLYWVIPRELRELWRGLERTGFTERKRMHDMVDAYARAAVALYGVLREEALLTLLRERGLAADVAQTQETLRELADGRDYRMSGAHLLAPTLPAEAASAYLTADAWLVPYVPPHEQMLHRGENGYYDPVPELERWRLEAEEQYRTQGLADAPLRAAAFADSVYAALQTELCDGSHEQLLRHFGLPLDERRVRRIKDRTRLWCLRGNTPADLLAQVSAGTLKPPVNGRCPCGSGKKYKHCHGR